MVASSSTLSMLGVPPPRWMSPTDILPGRACSRVESSRMSRVTYSLTGSWRFTARVLQPQYQQSRAQKGMCR